MTGFSMDAIAKGKNKKRILLVDDNTNLLDALKVFIEEKGYGVTTATAGNAALDIFLEKEGTEDPISMVITDLQMPFMGGVKLVEAVRRRNLEIPILVITGNPEEIMVKKISRFRVEGIEIKPFMPEVLLERIGRILDR